VTRATGLRSAFGLLVMMVALVAVSPVSASNHFNPSEVFREVRCVTCGTTLDVSNAPAALQLKNFILDRWRAGQSKDEILDAVVAEFGEDVLATPPKSGFGLVAWVVPAVAILVGLLVIVVVSRRWVRRRRATGDDDVTDMAPADRERLDRELERLGDI
jgi:cytochrome c-type biogenesis protein CcmH